MQLSLKARKICGECPTPAFAQPLVDVIIHRVFIITEKAGDDSIPVQQRPPRAARQNKNY